MFTSLRTYDSLKRFESSDRDERAASQPPSVSSRLETSPSISQPLPPHDALEDVEVAFDTVRVDGAVATPALGERREVVICQASR